MLLNRIKTKSIYPLLLDGIFCFCHGTQDVVFSVVNIRSKTQFTSDLFSALHQRNVAVIHFNSVHDVILQATTVDTIFKEVKEHQRKT